MLVVPSLRGIVAASAGAAAAPGVVPLAFKEFALNVADLGNVNSKTVVINGVAGDFWLGFVFENTGETINDPAGWGSPIVSVANVNSAARTLKVWPRVLSGAVSNPAFTLTGNDDQWAAGVIAFTGVNASTQIDATPVTDNNDINTSDCTAPSIVTATNGALVLRLVTSGAAVSSADGNFTSVTDIFARTVEVDSLLVGAAYGIQATAGASGTLLFDNIGAASGDGRQINATIALRPII